MQDITVIFRRRGGCDLVQNHEQWTNTVPFAPDIISMTFIPIISLLEDLPGTRHLERAIGLYLECKFYFFVFSFLIKDHLDIFAD